MIEPLLSDDAFLADVRGVRDATDPADLHFWWLGQSGFLLLSDGKFVLLDPYLSDSLTKKYAATDKPHVRMTRRVIDPGRLGLGISVVTSSHNHTDHLDADTLKPLLAANPAAILLAPRANVDFVAGRAGVAPSDIAGIDAGESLDIDGISFTAIPAAHETIERDALGRHKYLGYVIRLGDWTLFHSGDTVRFDGMDAMIRSTGTIDVAFLPINGRSPERRVAGNLDGSEAAILAGDIGARLAIPCHFEMFEFNTADPAEFVESCEGLAQRYRVLQAGERCSQTHRS